MNTIRGHKCKGCEQYFHACISCGMTYDWEYDYHNEECYRKSEDFEKVRKFIEDKIFLRNSRATLDVLKESLYDSDIEKLFVNADYQQEFYRQYGEKFK